MRRTPNCSRDQGGGISLPSVPNIKKALGMVKTNGPKIAKGPAGSKLPKKRIVAKAPEESAPAAPKPPAPEAGAGQ